MRKAVYDKAHIVEGKMKRKIDKRIKADDFQIGDFVLKWDVRNEDNLKKNRSYVERTMYSGFLSRK